MISLHEMSPKVTRLLAFLMFNRLRSSSSSTIIGTLLFPSSPLFALLLREVLGVGGGGLGVVKYFGLKWPLSNGPALNFLFELTKLFNSLCIHVSPLRSTSPDDDRTGGRFTSDSFKSSLEMLPGLAAAAAVDQRRVLAGALAGSGPGSRGACLPEPGSPLRCRRASGCLGGWFAGEGFEAADDC